MDQLHNTPEGRGILWLVLDSDSQHHLRRIVPPRYQNTYYHHVTLLFGATKQEAMPFIGQRHRVAGYAHAHNNEAQALRVQTENLPDTYGVPHITLSTAEGIDPFASVAMLQGDHIEQPLSPPLLLTGTISFQPLK